MIRKLITLGAVAFFGFLVFQGFITINNKTTAEAHVYAYFYHRDNIYPVKRVIPAGKQQVDFAFEQLLQGPTDQEARFGIVTQIPLGISLNRVEQRGDVVNLYFDESLLQLSGGLAVIEGLLKQCVYTGVQFPGVRAVSFQIAGQPDKSLALGGEGYIIEAPLTKESFSK